MENIYFNVNNREEKESYLRDIISKLENENITENIFILDKPLIINTDYSYKEILIILIPNYKISVINIGQDEDLFNEAVEEIVEDIGKISWRYNFEEIIGRPKRWKNKYIKKFFKFHDFLEEDFNNLKIIEKSNKRLANLLISFFIGSINEAKRIKSLEIPERITEAIKRRIILLDTDQVRFIFEEPQNLKRVVIQGLSGTGKTELLFHKLKELYMSPNNYRLLLTCHNKVLADELRRRIIKFFNIMQVPKQINSEFLKIFHAWGSKDDPESGTYRYITHFYKIPFYTFSAYNFDQACKMAIEEIKKLKDSEEFEYAFDYILIDESQDFPESFFELCELVTKEKVYIAGDVFQNIFEYREDKEIKPYIVLNKCYRTDNKNLMFSHALSMGLFEKPHLRWFKEDDDWKKLGYTLEKEKINNENTVKLSRRPLKRFLDIDEEIESIIVYDNIDLAEKTIEILKNLREEFDITPDDISIILIDKENYIYDLINILSYKIFKEMSWKCNIAIETKKREQNSVFITNRNNVKGLEFPFVICLTKEMIRDLSYRNTLYAMLSRSLIRSYLLLENRIGENILTGLKKIKEAGFIETYEPDDEELREIFQNIISYNMRRKTFKEILEEVFEEMEIKDKEKKEKLERMIMAGIGATFEKEKLKKFIERNLEFID